MATTPTTTDIRLLHGQVYESAVDTVYNTPLIKLNRLGPDNGSKILVKCEFFNPMASVKDRIGRAMIEAAEKDGRIGPDTHIVEPTSGNTGIALAFVCAARGYKLTLTMPESMSVERRALLKGLGAELVLTPAAEGMKGAISAAQRIADEKSNAYIPQQFANPANPGVHFRTTGPEIWNDTKGNVDIMVAGVGTGGTITGVTRFIRQHKPDFQAIAVEPVGSPVIAQTRAGDEVKPGPHKIQGIGAGFIPDNLEVGLLNGTEAVTNEDAFKYGRMVAKMEGIFGGISTGANVCAAIRVAEKNPGKTIVTIGCSFGERYLSTPMFDETGAES